MADVMEAAKFLCEKDAKTEQNCFGELLPCRKISPLEPFIKLEEYFMLERDTGKYLLYMAAIDRAISDIVQSMSNTDNINCFVLGPGLGRLVRFCLDSALHHGIPVCVHVMEANPVAVDFLKKSFEKEIMDEIVMLYEPFVFHPEVTAIDLPGGLQKYCGAFDLIVSELLGCFGDDEFLPELTASLYRLFAKPKKGIMIPDSWTNYLVPVSSPSTYHYLTSNNKSLNAGYTMGLPKDCTFLSEVKPVWTGDCKKVKDEYSCQCEFHLDIKPSYKTMSSQLEECDTNTFECFHGDRCCQATVMSCIEERNRCCHDNDCTVKSVVQKCKCNDDNIVENADDSNHDAIYINHEGTSSTENQECIENQNLSSHGNCEPHPECHTHLHGFLGYFTSTLYKDIMIDTRHMSTNRNAFHWECYFLPVLRPVLIGQNSSVGLSIARKTHLNTDKTIRLWFEWQVTVENKQHSSNDLLEMKRFRYDSKEEETIGCTKILLQTKESCSIQETVGDNKRFKYDNKDEETIGCTKIPLQTKESCSIRETVGDNKQFKYDSKEEGTIGCNKILLQTKESCSIQETVGDNKSKLTCKHKLPLQNQDGDIDCVYLSTNKL